MRKLTASLLLACLLYGGPASFAQDEAQDEAQDGQSDQQWQPAESRDLWDSMWKKQRKPSGQQPKRRKYQRVGVANSSAVALKYRRPVAATRKRRPARPSLSWQNLTLDSSEQLGVTIWRLRRCGAGGRGRRCFLPLSDGQGRTFMYEAVRVTTHDDFRVGDGIQLAVESPVRAFVYVIHQEVDMDGRPGVPKLLYPLREGGNVVGPGRPLLIPAQPGGGEVKVLKMRNQHGRGLRAERLKIIVARREMEDIFRQEGPRDLGVSDLQLWESRWTGRLELFDLEGGGRETMSPNEWEAMQAGNDGSRDLTTGDLAPQKLYVVERKRNDGVLITLDLPYGS